MMSLKKSKETTKELDKNVPTKKLLSQLLIRMFLKNLHTKKIEYFVTMFSTE